MNRRLRNFGLMLGNAIGGALQGAFVVLVLWGIDCFIYWEWAEIKEWHRIVGAMTTILSILLTEDRRKHERDQT